MMDLNERIAAEAEMEGWKTMTSEITEAIERVEDELEGDVYLHWGGRHGWMVEFYGDAVAVTIDRNGEAKSYGYTNGVLPGDPPLTGVLPASIVGKPRIMYLSRYGSVAEAFSTPEKTGVCTYDTHMGVWTIYFDCIAGSSETREREMRALAAIRSVNEFMRG